jgi:hypothetical protein
MLRRVVLVRTDVSQELVTASVVPSSPDLVTLMKEALSYSEASVLTRAKRRNIPEDGILHVKTLCNFSGFLLRNDAQECGFRGVLRRDLDGGFSDKVCSLMGIRRNREIKS